jgi:hypothetical protein
LVVQRLAPALLPGYASNTFPPAVLVQRRTWPFLALVVVLALSSSGLRQGFCDDFAPGGPQGGDLPYTPPNNRTTYPGSGYGAMPATPTRPVDPVRPDSWPGGAPTPPPQSGLPYPGPATSQLPPSGQLPQSEANPCVGSQLIAIYGSEIILSHDLLVGLDETIERVRDKMPNGTYAEQRKLLAGEVMAAVSDMAAHANDPNPLAQVDPKNLNMVRSLLKQQLDLDLIYQDACKNMPEENLSHAQETLDKMFEQEELPKLLKRLGVQSQAELELQLRSMGSSLESEKGIFRKRALVSFRVRDKVKFDEEITHEELLAWYQAHLDQFETPTRARWEELMVRIDRFPGKAAAYAAIARMGNQVLAGTPLAQVAKAQSDGPTASDGGLHDWTRKGSLVAEQLDRALFGLPIGQLSPILESATSFHPGRHPQKNPPGTDQQATERIPRQAAARNNRLDDLQRARCAGRATPRPRRSRAILSGPKALRPRSSVLSCLSCRLQFPGDGLPSPGSPINRASISKYIEPPAGRGLMENSGITIISAYRPPR